MEDNNFANLDETTKLLRKESVRYSMALELANGDDNKAKDLMRPQNQDVLAIKWRFYEVNLNIYGIAILFYHRGERRILSKVFLINYDQDIYQASPYSSWSEFRSNIESMRMQGRAELQLHNDFEPALEETLTFGQRDNFNSFVETGSESLLHEILEQVLMNAFGSQNFDIEEASENINIVDFHVSENSNRLKNQKEEDDIPEQPAAASPGFSSIDVSPVVSPVHGVVIHQITEGDVIFVRVTGQSPLAANFLSRMVTKYDMDNPKVPVVVKRIDRSDPKFIVMYVQLEENLMGKIIETDPVRVMKVNPKEVDKNLRGETAKRSEGSMMTYFIYAAIGLGVFTLLAVVFILLFGSGIL